MASDQQRSHKRLIVLLYLSQGTGWPWDTFELIGFNKEFKCLLCILSGICHTNIMDILFCLGLIVFWQDVEYVCRLVNPVALATTGLEKNLSYCFPET